MRELALFAGTGGGILGGHLLGWRTVCAVEIDPFCREVLLRRQMDGCLSRFPIWDDVQTFDGRPWRGKFDIVSGGFPCQDISPAGSRKGLAGSRSSLWFEMSRIIGEVRPRFALAENSPHLRAKGLGTVVYELTGMGYECRWGVLGARHVGAPHKQRNRIWIVASDPDRVGVRIKHGWRCWEDWEEKAELALSVADTDSERELQQKGLVEGQPDSESIRRREERTPDSVGGESRRFTTWWAVEPDVVRVVHGLPFRVDRVRALGNAQIPAVAALAWDILSGSPKSQ